jgi:hypothetical protein
MQTDRELLKLAAKAAGEITPILYGNDDYFDGVLSWWNPLTDDGDALRLAVKIKWVPSRVEVVGLSMNEDPYAATRRAIVRAAAAMGKDME